MGRKENFRDGWKQKKASSKFYLPFSAYALKIIHAILDFKMNLKLFKIYFAACLINPWNIMDLLFVVFDIYYD